MASTSSARSTILALAVTAALFALPWLLGTIGTKPLGKGAREEFSRVHLCPISRVEVRPRSDLTPWDLHVAKWGRSTPPDEVARDPERLALWKEQEREREDRENGDAEVFEVRGCGRQVLWSCDHPGGPGGEIYSGMVSCEEGPYPTGSEKPW
jgi:hypothetical protein